MAEVLEYIEHQIENLKDTIKDDNLLKSTGIYEGTLYISRNAGVINGSLDVNAKYGISVDYLKSRKDEARKEKEPLKAFIDMVSGKGADRDVKQVLTKLFQYKTDELIKAFVNKINYIILNNMPQSSERGTFYQAAKSNIDYYSLPYGQLVPSLYNGSTINDKIIDDYIFRAISDNLSPCFLQNLEREKALNVYNIVYNKDGNYLKFDYLKTEAEGFISREDVLLNISQDLSCYNLTDTRGFLQQVKERDEGCSSDELRNIEEKLNFVKNISNNTDFVKIEEFSGQKLYNLINNYARLSSHFIDNKTGENSINIKLYFDKQKDYFASVRSNDLKLALFCANYGNEPDNVIDIYFNQENEDVYIVNKNKEQYGYCKGLFKSEMSNCEQTIYLQLLQPSLSIEQKNELLEDGNILPIVLDENIVRKTEGLEEAITRQSYLMSLEDDEIFYDLFIRNIASYVYSYAQQVEKKDTDGNIKFIWETIPNPNWSKLGKEDNWIPIYNDKGGLKWYQYQNPDIFYIYDVRETFWTINQNLSIKEVLAYFISKGGSKYDNSSYYRKLSQRILGVDYYAFTKRISPFLLSEGYLCIKDIEFDNLTNSLLKLEYSYKYDYIKDDVYKKLDYLLNYMADPITKYFGDVKGAKIIENQISLLEDNKPKTINFGNKDKARKLTLSIHNPIFYDKFRDTDYVNRYAFDRNIFNKGRISISTFDNKGEKFKPIDYSPNKKLQIENYEEIDRDIKNTHIDNFIKWLKFGSQARIAKDYISEKEMIDGYVLPLPAKEFIPIYLMGSFEYKDKSGEVKEYPLYFMPSKKSSEEFFTRTNIYKNLDEASLENLYKAGLKESKNKFTEDEAKDIYDIIMAKYNKLVSEIRLEGDRLFTLFCQTQFTGEYKIEIENKWNARYNNMAIADYSKFPVFCEHSRWFGGYKKENPFPFNLREAQVEGLKFSVANSNAGLLAHEVGFGKTTTSIALFSHMNLTGSSSRNLVFTPKQVYEKFYDEITGNENTGILGLLGNHINPYNVIKLGNARKDVLMGKLKPMYKGSDIYQQEGNDALKIYDEQEIQFIQDFKNIVDEAKSEMGNIRIMPSGQPRFFTEPELINETPNDTRISSRVMDSNAQDWWSSFYGKLLQTYGDIIELPSVEELLDRVDVEIQKNYDIVEREIENFKNKNRYTINSFMINNKPSKEKISELPKYIQKWWSERIKKLPKDPNGKVIYNIRKEEYPHKYWVREPEGLLEFGFITQKELKEAQEKNKNLPGTLTPQGFELIEEKDRNVSRAFFNKEEGKQSGRMTTLLNAIRDMLIDELGYYKDYVLRENSVVLCYHQAIDRFRVSKTARTQAQNFVANIDDEYYSPNNVRTKYNLLGNKALSLNSLNITGLVVDEIHNFNNLVSRPRPATLSLIPDIPGGQTRNLTLLPTQKSSAVVDKLPSGGGIGQRGSVISGFTTSSQNASERKNPYLIGFNSTGKGSLKNGPTNLLAIVFEIQNTAKTQNIKEKNTIMMSATPFTDNVFQMFSVFGMTNVERMKEANMDKVFDFFITFVKEEWRYNLTHRNVFGLFAEIEGYYNTYAMSNFIKSFANFKVSDAVIEAKRPQKYLIPQNEGRMVDGKLEGGANTSAVNYDEDLREVSSYIELSDVQKEMLKKIAEFVEGKIDTPYAICPNYLDVKIEKSGSVVFTDEETQKRVNEINKEYKLSKTLRSQGNNEDAESSAETAYELAYDLLIENSKNKVIQKIFEKVSKLIDGASDEEEEEGVSQYDLDIDSIGLTALDEEQIFTARAIVGQSYGQSCVISPYLLKCDTKGNLQNSLLKNYPLDKEDLSLSAKNFVEQSPKIKYAVDCAINSIVYDSFNLENKQEIGGQIIYLDRGKNFRYGGNTYNAYELIRTYIADKKITYQGQDGEDKTLTKDEIIIITGAMGGSGLREQLRDKFNFGEAKILIGSSAIKEGIDLNKRAHTLYILDSDFSPSNAMQLEGRIWRQGNMWKYVRIVYVLGRDSIDAFVYSKLQQKINEIKKMLEAGVYELNKTQFTIDAKERIKKIISDIDQLTELEWQDKNDELNNKNADLSSRKSDLTTISREYGRIKKDYANNIKLINTIYQIVLKGEKIKIAKDIKQDYDILNENKYRVEAANKGLQWRKENPFNPMSIDEALKILDEEIKDNKRVFPFLNKEITEETNVINAAPVISQVIKFISSNKTTLQTISVNKEVRENVLKGIRSKKQEERILSDELIEVLFTYNDWKAFDHILKEVSMFEQGSPKERVLSNYTAFVSSVNKKDENNVEIISNNKPVKCDISDVPMLIANIEKEISSIEKQLSTAGERKYKELKSQQIIDDMANQRKITGESVEELVEKFDISMKLLKLRD